MGMAAYAHVVDISPQTQHGYEARCWKQSVDRQAQLGVGGKDGNNSRTKRAAKFWIKLFLAVRRRSHCILQSLAILPKISQSTVVLCVRTYVRTLPDFATAIQSGNETTQKSNA